MPRQALTLEKAQEMVDKKFPGKGFKLTAFVKSKAPCLLFCPLHGEQRISTFNNLIQVSRCGCPQCGREVNLKNLQTHSQKTHLLAKLVRQIDSLVQQPLSDEQLGEAVKAILLEAQANQDI